MKHSYLMVFGFGKDKTIPLTFKQFRALKDGEKLLDECYEAVGDEAGLSAKVVSKYMNKQVGICKNNLADNFICCS